MKLWDGGGSIRVSHVRDEAGFAVAGTLLPLTAEIGAGRLHHEVPGQQIRLAHCFSLKNPEIEGAYNMLVSSEPDQARWGANGQGNTVLLCYYHPSVRFPSRGVFWMPTESYRASDNAVRDYLRNFIHETFESLGVEQPSIWELSRMGVFEGTQTNYEWKP